MFKFFQDQNAIMFANGRISFDAMVIDDNVLAIDMQEDSHWDSQRVVIHLDPKEASALKEFLIAQGY